MARQACDGWVVSLQGHRVIFTGKVTMYGEHWTRDELSDEVQEHGAAPVRGTQNARVTLLVQGDLSGSRVTDPIRVRSKKAVYVDKQRGRANHICIVDESGIAALLSAKPAPCLQSRTIDSETVELNAVAEPHVSAAFLLTNNPEHWDWADHDLREAIEATRDRRTFRTRWSTGGRTHLIGVGARAFLLRQGRFGRGIVASGHFASAVYREPHWGGSADMANYADVDWDTVVLPEDLLPIDDLLTAAPSQEWHPQSSGTRLLPETAAVVEGLWAGHVAGLGLSAKGAPQGNQGHQAEQELKGETENEAQRRLMNHYRDAGWKVEDTHVGHPYDALATMVGHKRYLEAKGTTTPGTTVIVTRREIEHAREHQGECVLGIVSGIEVGSDGRAVPGSGVLRVIEPWQPDEESLKVRQYDYRPPA